MQADPRPAEELDRVLADARAAFDKLDDDDKPFYDTERLTNPYLEVRGLLTGVDMETAEVLLADRLREKGEPIDLILAHHPEGPGFANLDQVMYMQADLWHAQGVGLGVGDSLIATRASEIRRKLSPYNHYRAIQAPRYSVSRRCHATRPPTTTCRRSSSASSTARSPPL
jgi:hypothetical protein